MQHWPTESSETQHQQDNPSDTTTSVQHGFCSRQQPNGVAVLRREETGSASPRSVPDGGRRDSFDAVSAAQLDEKLRRLSVDDSASVDSHSAVAGQRVIDYENAQTPSTPRQALGFKVIKRSDNRPDSVQLTDFPNELLTHVLSHLHPDSHSAIALVSKRFYSLVTTPHAWRMAFLRFFPGHDSLATKSGEQNRAGPLDHDSFEFVRSESRYFSRLTSLATWRSEYLLRTRLLRGLIRGKPGTKPGGIGASGRSSKKTSAVLTYNSKLPWAVTHIHADFTVKKAPRVIHGTADLGAATLSDSFIGKVEKWGFRDPFTILQLDEVFPNLEPYGAGDGPAACPNVMDVSQPYGMLSGEGFPGGRAYYRPINEMHGRYLGNDTGVIDTYPDIPKIPELSEAISAVWVAKSTAVPNITHSTVGIITGSTLGIVTTYALHGDGSGPRHPNGEMTARWVLSPGVPIVSIKVDDQYTQKRKTAQRVWAVALNALGEVFYLVDVPKTSLERSKGEDVTKNAWFAGRSVYWRLIDDSRRQARPDEFDKHALRGAYSPRSPADAMNLSKEQLVAEAREIEKFLRYKPSHFRKVCDGWDMRRRLEVDFANDDAGGAGEVIVSIHCGLEETHPPSVTRYARAMSSTPRQTPDTVEDTAAVEQDVPPVQQSIFGSGRDYKHESQPQPKPTKTVVKGDVTPISSGSLTPQAKLNSMDEWAVATMSLGNHGGSEITASALDLSSHALLTLTEDPLQFGSRSAATPTMTPQTAESSTEIPGRRTRMLAVGTKDGSVVVWNCREQRSLSTISPLRIIQTESPEISCLALTALYLVHGGNDGLVQAWDPLASSLEPLRTLNGRSNGRVPRHMMTMNPALPIDTYSAARAIYLDPDPTVLRGITSFGAFLRYWSYSATHQPPGRKRRLRHADVHGRLATRRQGGNVSGYIAAETAELRREEEQDIKEEAWLRNRFGVGAFGDLTEEEALQYAEMISQETLLLEEQRRTSASDTGSAADASFDTVSSFSESTVDTVTPEPSITGFTPPPPVVEEEDEYEQQLQQALRLSLMEATDDVAQSPRKNSSSDFEFAIKYKSKPAKKTTKRTPSMSPPATYKPVAGAKAGSSSKATPRDDDLELALLLSSAGSASHPAPRDDDLELALRLSLQENGAGDFSGLGIQQEQEEFPMLETRGKGKGKM
ncbi:F-box domain-containing protein [Colletotrichum scovillei]|uniref:F-box domain-containing protein n=1 Tax=Colletotrichum scovillei TaxID=1209932 RepID=A0A9P7R354_9PEZI|nr:F-box domain-containing protein [Colletotrichum scovillei]KAF4773985.1 F-box domain-containing protein [Colletotrichum scovillei]KAG7048647.1 F-box domain-containing protein [Colletotrichum scovillei]KAG7065813.1 F-box domain-containing protein [Colletotrichum scovillei]KAG7068412.1 F-box domain-containing protein [Colletotrichum scovillei]